MICSTLKGYIALGQYLPALGEQIVMSPSLKGNSCILLCSYTVNTELSIFNFFQIEIEKKIELNYY